MLLSLEVECNFEEVYKNGEVQQGGLLIKKDMLRYEYFDKDLYTIIFRKNDYLMVNNNTKIVQQINEHKEILDMLYRTLSSYPNIQKEYKDEEFIIKMIESSNNFIKRISIQSNSINMSINLHNCKFKNIHKKYFNHFNFIEYSY